MQFEALDIKVWSKKNKEFQNIEVIDFIDKSVTTSKTFGSFDDYILLRYIGYNTDTGERIYESDIIEYTYGGVKYYLLVVETWEPELRLHCLNDYEGFEVLREEYNYSYEFLDYGNIRMIGNNYEDPKLADKYDETI